MTSLKLKERIIESPVVSIKDFYDEFYDFSEKLMIIHTNVAEGKVILNKKEASLLLIELNKFIKS
jgi:hypothetical protein